MAVYGTGYLGATHAAAMAELGHQVIGVDVDKAKLDKPSSGEAPFYEPGLDELLRANLDAGRLRSTSSYEDAAEATDIHFVAVSTPQKRVALCEQPFAQKRADETRAAGEQDLFRSLHDSLMV